MQDVVEKTLLGAQVRGFDPDCWIYRDTGGEPYAKNYHHNRFLTGMLFGKLRKYKT